MGKESWNMKDVSEGSARIPEKREDRRLMALDGVRGLAVAGMYIQHFALNERNGGLVSGNTMILFMLCSGISYALMEQGARRKGMAPETLRTRILARSLLIDLAGYVLILLNGPFGVVLPAYAMLFLLAMPLHGRSRRQLLAASGLLFLLSPPLMVMGLSLLSGAALLEDMAGGPLSALAWAPVFVLGMAIGQMDLRDRRLPARLAAAGTAILIPITWFSRSVLPGLREQIENWMVQAMAAGVPEPDLYAVWPRNTQPIMWNMLFVDAPQGGSLFELLSGTGLSLILLGAFLWLDRGKAAGLLKPFAAAGKAALSLYMAQFLLAWALILLGLEETLSILGGIPFGDFLAAGAVLAAGWLLGDGKGGPMERLLRRFEGWFLESGNLVQQA